MASQKILSQRQNGMAGHRNFSSAIAGIICVTVTQNRAFHESGVEIPVVILKIV
jgi:hypothetical protein